MVGRWKVITKELREARPACYWQRRSFQDSGEEVGYWRGLKHGL